MNAGQDGNDTLAGMYLLAQQWLLDVLPTKFSDIEDQRLSLDNWFKSPQVSWKIQVESVFIFQMPQS